MKSEMIGRSMFTLKGGSVQREGGEKKGVQKNGVKKRRVVKLYSTAGSEWEVEYGPRKKSNTSGSAGSSNTCRILTEDSRWTSRKWGMKCCVKKSGHTRKGEKVIIQTTTIVCHIYSWGWGNA